jgi:hypothetical protein
MFKFQTQVQYLAWNNDIEKAIFLLEPHSSTNLLCRLDLIHVQMLRHILSGGNDKIHVDEIFQMITDAEHFTLQFKNNDEALLEMAKDTIELNNNQQDTLKDDELVDDIGEYSQQQLLTNFKLSLQTCQAELALLRAGLQYYHGHFLKAAYNIRTSWKQYELVYNQLTKTDGVHPDIISCIKCGYGTLKYALGILPPSIRWILDTIGYSGDKKDGLNMLRQASQESTRLSPFACLVLNMHYIIISGGGVKPNHERLTKCQDVLQSCLQQYPHGLPFTILAAHFSRKVGDVDAAVRYLESSLLWSRKMLDMTPKFVQAELAQCYFLERHYPNVCQVCHVIY